jgi:hypothetical protein
MAKIQLRLFPRDSLPNVCLDGKEIPMKKQRDGSLLYEGTVNKETADLRIFVLPPELGGKKDFRKFLFFFLISILGVFNPPYPKNEAYFFDYQGKMDTKEDVSLSLTLGNKEENSPALIAKEGLLPANSTNVLHFDKKYKGRRRTVLFLKILFTIAFYAGFGYLLYKTIFQ